MKIALGGTLKGRQMLQEKPPAFLGSAVVRELVLSSELSVKHWITKPRYIQEHPGLTVTQGTLIFSCVVGFAGLNSLGEPYLLSKLQVRKVVPVGQIKFIVQLFLLRTLDLGKQRRTKVVHNSQFNSVSNASNKQRIWSAVSRPAFHYWQFQCLK